MIGRERPSDFGLLDVLGPRFDSWDHDLHMECGAINRLLGAGRGFLLSYAKTMSFGLS